MKTVVVVQARMGSTRFPNKVLRPVAGVPLIELLLSRLSRAKRVDQIVLATPEDVRNEPLVAHARKLGFAVYQGSEKDVLDRYYHAASVHKPDAVVRITGDCPLVDPALVDALIGDYENGGADYVSNTLAPTYPDGLDVEVFSFAALERAWKEADTAFDREHVTPYIKSSGSSTVQRSAERSSVCAILRIRKIVRPSAGPSMSRKTSPSWDACLSISRRGAISAGSTCSR